MNVGFMSYWGFGRGMCNTTLMWAKMLYPEHNIFILKYGKNEIEEYYKSVPVHITESEDYIVPKEQFKSWVVDNKLDVVVFDEYKQWTNEPDNHVALAKSLGCKVYGYLVMEKFIKGQEDDYDRIICTSLSHQRFMRAQKVRKHVYLPFSIDLNEFPKKDRILDKDFTFFHCGGFGGYLNRKNTDLVIEAFVKLKKTNPNIKLILTSQRGLNFQKDIPEGIELINKNLSRKEIVDLYYRADALVIPSRWETVGVGILEALASGIPVVTPDVMPMNEFVRTGLNGYLIKPDDIKPIEGVSVYSAEMSSDEIKKSMELIMNPTIYPMLARNARAVAEKLYDLEKNKKYFLDILKEDSK